MDMTKKLKKNITFSKKVFLPLTHLCRDTCHYCTFAKTPNQVSTPFMTWEDIKRVISAAENLECKEVLITVGDKPEIRYPFLRSLLEELDCASTVDYVYKVCDYIINNTNLIPHVNCGVLNREELMMLRKVSPSMGLMLETSSKRLSERGQVHYGCPDKNPDVRLECIRIAGELKIPFTTGILVGIGETRDERFQSLIDIKEIHDHYGHIQEVIIQPFMPKEDTKMKNCDSASLEETLWTISIAREIFGSDMSIQTPPNLSHNFIDEIAESAINDFGGISPLTIDYVNPECGWPNINQLKERLVGLGISLEERLSVYPSFVLKKEEWIDRNLWRSIYNLSDSQGYARVGKWHAGIELSHEEIGSLKGKFNIVSSSISSIVKRCQSQKDIYKNDIIKLFSVRDDSGINYLRSAANELKQDEFGNEITFVSNMNINYTNICSYKCSFCSFSRTNKKESTLEAMYLYEIPKILEKCKEAYDMGVTEVCLQGGIHPNFDGNTYLQICKAIRQAFPSIHIHAFSPLEIKHGATTLNLSISEYLFELRNNGLNSLPGTAAEILNDDVRSKLSCNKLNTGEWVEIIKTAHELGLSTTSTIMFGHLDSPIDWADHLSIIKSIQVSTGKITEFVPLPFVHVKSPIYLNGRARKGPTIREALLMHSISRLILHFQIKNIQTSWPKMGINGALECLLSGANDIGGTLVNESISRAAGAQIGQQLSIEYIKGKIASINNVAIQRNTMYQPI